jgi:hypothetical protein
MIPQKTDVCWVISREQKVRPPTSITYFALSRKSMRSAMRSMGERRMKPETGDLKRRICPS